MLMEDREMNSRIKLKMDRHRRARGGKARLLDLFCRKCGAWLLTYQKDGTGRLLRCYVDRIAAPPELAGLQRNTKACGPHRLPVLRCRQCTNLIGSPMRHHSGRIAFRLCVGAIEKRSADRLAR